jgi:hypothetical protein
VAIAGNDDYITPEFVLPRPSTYRWVASYSATFYTGIGPTACGAAGETAVADATPRPSPDPGPHAPLTELGLRPRPKPALPVPSPPLSPLPLVTG